MIRLTTALLALGVGMAIATTAIAMEPPGWCNCNPEAPACRVYCGSDPEGPPANVAPVYPTSMYMYVPRHNTRMHKNAPR
jgi:hypothetical protein